MEYFNIPTTSRFHGRLPEDAERDEDEQTDDWDGDAEEHANGDD